MIGARRGSGPGNRRAAAGFSMIEVLVSLLVLALGLLGFALLQTMNLRYTQSADYRTHATNLGYELLDQMRANRMSAADFQAASFIPGEVSGGDCGRPTGTVTIDDLVDRWQCQVFETLGENSAAQVAYTPGNGLVVIVLTWGERFTADPQTSFELETHL